MKEKHTGLKGLKHLLSVTKLLADRKLFSHMKYITCWPLQLQRLENNTLIDQQKMN